MSKKVGKAVFTDDIKKVGGFAESMMPDEFDVVPDPAKVGELNRDEQELRAQRAAILRLQAQAEHERLMSSGNLGASIGPVDRTVPAGPRSPLVSYIHTDGSTTPAIVASVNADGSCNLHVFVDGPHVAFMRACRRGNDPGCWEDLLA